MKTEQGMLKRKLETTLEEARQERRLSDDFSKNSSSKKRKSFEDRPLPKSSGPGNVLQKSGTRSDNGRKRTTKGSRGSPEVKRGRTRRQIARALRTGAPTRRGTKGSLTIQGTPTEPKEVQSARLVEARGKENEAESQLEELKETLEGWKRRCQDIADEAKIQVRAATIDAQFWKDRYIKLAWLANQALMNIPQRLRAAEDMVDPTRTPREIQEFLEQRRKLYDRMKKLSAPS
ncbi:hypothetical protein CR513_00609, partial [Mucuna pruriens]